MGGVGILREERATIGTREEGMTLTGAEMGETLEEQTETPYYEES